MYMVQFWPDPDPPPAEGFRAWGIGLRLSREGLGFIGGTMSRGSLLMPLRRSYFLDS